MAKRRAGLFAGLFKGRHFTSEVILWALRWYLAFSTSYRDLASMLSDRGVEVDHTTLFRWVQAYAPALERRTRRHLRPCNGSWRVDETHIKVRGVWTYLYRAVDCPGQTIDFWLSARRNATHPSAVTRLKRAGQLWRFSRLRQCRYLSNIVEQGHHRIKRLGRPGLGFGGLRTARRTLAGYEAMAMIRKGQVHNVGGRDMKAQATFVAGLFGVAA